MRPQFLFLRRPMPVALMLSLAFGVVALKADLTALRTRDPVVIDGRLDEAMWTRAQATENFAGTLQADGTVSAAKSGARVRMLWDDRNLYLAFECEGAPGAATLRERDGLLHTEEVVEVFLDFLGTGTEYLELQVSPAGVLADLYHQWQQKPTYAATLIDEAQRQKHRSDRDWNLDGVQGATATISKEGKVSGWTAEVALPITHLVRKPAGPLTVHAGQTMRANFVHYRYEAETAGGQPVMQQSSWIPVVHGRPHVSPMAMGTIRCIEPRPVNASVETWREASRLLVRDANRGFGKLAEKPRESRFGEAVTLLNVQPRTESNVESAGQTLAALVKENADDEPGIAARYYLGRLEQTHRFVAIPARALEYYDALVRDHPRHLFGQMAGVKACVLRLYETGVPVPQRLAAGEKLEPLFTILEMRRDYHLMMADAYARFSAESPRLLAHLLAADEAGHLARTARADLYVRIVDAAAMAGQKQIAIDYCRRFLAERTREARVALVQERLRAMEAKP